MSAEERIDEPNFHPPRRRRMWPLAVLVTTLVGAGIAIAVFLSRRPEPLRVLVAIDVQGVWWKGSPGSVALASSLAARLERLGFEPVRPGDREVVAALGREKSLDAAARRIGAAFVLTGQLDPEVEDHVAAGGQFTARAEGPVSLHHQSEPAAELGRVVSWASAPNADAAVLALAESMADPIFDAVMPALIEHRSIREILEGGDAAEKGRLSRAKAYAEQRRNKLDQVRKAYDAQHRQRTEHRGPVEVTYHGAIDRNAGLCSAGSNGVLIKTDQVRPFFSPDSRELGHILEPERVTWIEPDGKERVVFESYGLHGYASAAPEGTPLVAVEDLFGWARAVTLVDSAGQRRRLRVDARGWPSDPKVAPGGGLVALWERSCRGCPATIRVLGLPKGDERYRSDARKASLGGFAWLDARRLVVLERATEAKPAAADAGVTAPDRQKKKPALVDEPWTVKPVFPQTLTLFDFSQAPPKLELIHEAREQNLSALAASRDGRFLAMARRAEDGKELAVFDVEGRSLSTFTALAADNPSLSARGDSIAFERGGDIAVLERATGTTHVLTNNPLYERYPLFSADDSRVLFESRAEDPNFPRRTLSVIASVPAR